MARYIELDAVVTEIERQISAIDNCPKLTSTQIAVLEGDKVVLTKLLFFLDTLEVKDVNFDAEWKKYFEHRGEITTVNIKHLAKHFFKLGMAASSKAKKGE